MFLALLVQGKWVYRVVTEYVPCIGVYVPITFTNNTLSEDTISVGRYTLCMGHTPYSGYLCMMCAIDGGAGVKWG
jgi:hypothetical protein